MLMIMMMMTWSKGCQIYIHHGFGWTQTSWRDVAVGDESGGAGGGGGGARAGGGEVAAYPGRRADQPTTGQLPIRRPQNRQLHPEPTASQRQGMMRSTTYMLLFKISIRMAKILTSWRILCEIFILFALSKWGQASLSRACFCTNLSFSSFISQTEKEELLEEARKAGYLVTKLQQNLNRRDTDIQKLGAGGWPGP